MSDEREKNVPPLDSFKAPLFLNRNRAARKAGHAVNQDNWSSSELSALYTFLKQFGTGDASLEFISACGLDRSHDEVCAKVNEIRKLAGIASRHKVESLKRKFEEVGEGGLSNVIQQLPLDPVTKLTHNHWNAATLAMTSQFRGFNHSTIKNSIINGLAHIPSAEIPSSSITESPLIKEQIPDLTIDYGKIREFLNNATMHIPDVSSLNSLECAILLKIMDELWFEAADATNLKEKAVLRGFLKRLKERSIKDNLFSHPDFPCDELSATQLYIDPLRTRDWNIPTGGRKITRDDVDAIKSMPNDNFEEEDGPIGDIPLVQIDPSEINSSRYPPRSLVGTRRKSTENADLSNIQPVAIEDPWNATNNPEVDDKSKVMLHIL